MILKLPQVFSSQEKIMKPIWLLTKKETMSYNLFLQATYWLPLAWEVASNFACKSGELMKMRVLIASCSTLYNCTFIGAVVRIRFGACTIYPLQKKFIYFLFPSSNHCLCKSLVFLQKVTNTPTFYFA